eukprot:15251575-Ditylum_brightwellii.AAC.1
MTARQSPNQMPPFVGSNKHVQQMSQEKYHNILLQNFPYLANLFDALYIRANKVLVQKADSTSNCFCNLKATPRGALSAEFLLA